MDTSEMRLFLSHILYINTSLSAFFPLYSDTVTMLQHCRHFAYTYIMIISHLKRICYWSVGMLFCLYKWWYFFCQLHVEDCTCSGLGVARVHVWNVCVNGACDENAGFIFRDPTHSPLCLRELTPIMERVIPAIFVQLMTWVEGDLETGEFFLKLSMLQWNRSITIVKFLH